MVGGGGAGDWEPGMGSSVCVCDLTLLSPLLSPLAAGKLQPDTRSIAQMYIVNRNPCRYTYCSIVHVYWG